MAESSSPESFDASWNSDSLVLSSSDSLLYPVSQDSVVVWVFSDNALDDLIQPLVSGLAWSSSDDLDEVVHKVLESWSSSSEPLASPSDTRSLADVLVPGLHVFPGEGVSDWLIRVIIWLLWILSETWINWFDWLLDWLWSSWSWWSDRLVDWLWWSHWLWSGLWLRSWWKWLRYCSGQEPGLIQSLMAVPEDHMSSVSV